MNKFGTTRARSLMTCASIVALCAVMPAVASAQTTLTGAPGQALTTGSITSSTGNVVDGGANGPVNASGVSTQVTVDGATIASTLANSPGLNVFSTSSAGGSGLSAVFTGTNNISGTTSAVTVSGVYEDATLDASAGGGTYAGGLNANSQSGSATILSANNILTGSVSQAVLTAVAGGAGTTATVSSIGDSIVSGYGISANGLGGEVVVGPNGGVTSAMTLTSAAGIGIAATTSGTGTMTVTTGAGGTIDGGAWGVYANNGGGSGAINVTVGAAIGATSAPSASAIDVRSGSGPVTITATAPLASGGNTVYSYINGGAGDLTATTAGVTSTGGSAVDLNIFGSSSTGTVSYTLTGANAVQGTEGVYAANFGSGAISIQASDAGSSITGTNGAGVDARASGAGGVTVNVAGSVSGTTNGVYTQATSGATSITVGGPLSSGGTGIYATSTGGAISVLTGSTVSSTSGSGIYVNSVGQGGTPGGGAVSVGSADQRATGVTGGGGNGIFAAGAGDVTIYAGTVSGYTRGVLGASQSNGTSDGAVLIDVNGQVTAQHSYGVLGINFGVLASDTLTINTAGVTSTGGSAISAQSGFGDISITANGPIKANAGSNGSDWDAIYVGTVYSVAGGDPYNSDFNASITANGAVTGSWDGIEANLTGASTKGAITINAPGPVSGGASGILATSTGVAAINIGSAGSPIGAVTAANGAGVLAIGAGDVNLYTGAVSASGGLAATIASNSSAASGVTSSDPNNMATGYGVAALTSGGSIDIVAGGAVTGGAAGGMLAQNTSATGSVSVTTQAVTAASGRGIEADAQGGAVSITANGAVSGATTGIFATSTGGAISVLTASTVRGGTGSGIYVNSVGQDGTTGGGAVTVGAADQRATGITSTGSNGIFAAGAGDVTIYAGTVTGGTRGVLGASQSNGNADGAVLIDVNGQVTANNSYGVLGFNTGLLATDTLTIKTAGVTSTGGSAISAESYFGDVSITATGPIKANAGNGEGWDAIYVGSADSSSGDFNAKITATGAITGSYAGIWADLTTTSTKGAIAVNATGPISGDYSGVVAMSTGAGAINLGTLAAPLGTVTAGNGTGVFANGAGDVNVYTGAVTATGGAVATRLANPSTGANDGAATNVAVGQGFGIAAISTGGNVTVNASGLVTGGAAGGVLAQTLGTGSLSITTAGVTAGAGMGIEADSAGGDITVAANGAVSGATYGIYVANRGVDSAGSVTVTTGSTVTSGANYGINVQSLGLGAVNVGTSSQRLGGLVSGATTGILATGEGDINVYASDVTGGTRGIVASSQPATDSNTSNGAVTIDVSGAVTSSSGSGVIGVNNGVLAANTLAINANQVTATGGSAIYALSATGDISVTASGALQANAGNGSGWDAIYAGGTQSNSDLNITVKTTGSVNGSWDGIVADTTTASTKGAITINASGPITASNDGVSATGAGAGTITVATTGDITATAGGIVASNSGAGAVNIGGANGIGGVITTSGVGISGATNTGALTITTAAGSSIAPGATIGIQAVSASGPITINQGGDIGAAGANGAVGLGIDAEIRSASATSDININSTGGIYVAAGTGLQSAGIYAVNSGSGNVNVTTSGVIDPGAYGVVATSTGGGSTTVTTKGSIVAQTAALDLTAGTGGLNLTIGGSVTATSGPAVVASSAGAAAVNISSGATVTGLVTSANQGVINLDTASGQSSTINIASGAVVSAASGSAYNVAIRATGGSVVVNNEGEIEGVVDFSALTGSNTGTLNQAPGTLFVTSGTSNFGSGDANFANSGTLQTQGQTTTFVFGGTNNVFSNAGTIVVGGDSQVHSSMVHGLMRLAVTQTPSTFVLTNVTSFPNSGTLQMINGVVGDSIVAKGSNYVGSGAAKLAVDTVIGGPGSASDVLVVGTTSGHTAVQIHDAAATGSFGAYNPTGTAIVEGATHLGDFTLDPASSWYNASLFGGALDKPGFFFSQLGVDPTSGNTVLISAPKLQAYQFATLPTQGQSIWYDTTPQPERQGALRDQLAKGGASNSRPGVWVKVEGSTAQRDVNQSWAGAGDRYSYDAGYKQDIQTEMAGVDGLHRTAEGLGLAYGMSAGYVQSTAHFDRASTRTEMSGWTLNGYATVANKDVFAAFAFGGDAMTAKMTAPQLTGYTPTSVGVGSVGATFETGLRKPFLFGSTIEPSVGLAYVHTTVGELKSAGAAFHFDEAESLRASFGARVTGDVSGLGVGAWRTRYEVSLRGVDDLKGDNTTSLGSGGPALGLDDNFQKAFGEARIGLTTQNQGGWSGSASLRERFNSGSSDTGLSLGLRYQF